MNDFIFQNTTKIYFGPDQLKNLGNEVKQHGKRVLITYGGGSIKKIGLFDKVTTELNQAGLEVFEFGGIEPNPRVETVNACAAYCREKNIDVLLAVGGGSTIDASKVIAPAVFYEGDAWDLVIKKAPITQALPIISILTLSATGTEMNNGGVISKMDTHEKIGVGPPVMQPKASFLDPSNRWRWRTD
jgi:alcohol dehydrogenase YqhD (iron-dependent ADH family)